MENLNLKNFLTLPLSVGKFVLDQLQGGAWAELPHGELKPAVPPVRAHITYFNNLEKPQ